MRMPSQFQSRLSTRSSLLSRPEPTEAGIPVLAGISDIDVLPAGAGAGLACQTDTLRMICPASTSLGTDLSLMSTSSSGWNPRGRLIRVGDATEGNLFILAKPGRCSGFAGRALRHGLALTRDSSVVDETFGPNYITHRGPLDMAELAFRPGGCIPPREPHHW